MQRGNGKDARSQDCAAVAERLQCFVPPTYSIHKRVKMVSVKGEKTLGILERQIPSGNEVIDLGTRLPRSVVLANIVWRT